MLNCENFYLTVLDARYAKPLSWLEASIFGQGWDEDQFTRLLGQNHFLCCGALEHDFLRAYANGYILAGELEIVNVAVQSRYRNQGLGARLVLFMLDQALVLGLRRAILEVRQSNVWALALYARCGFKPTGVRLGYYSDTGEDALIMEWLNNIHEHSE